MKGYEKFAGGGAHYPRNRKGRGFFFQVFFFIKQTAFL